MQGPRPELFLIAAVVVTLAIGVWFFLLRGGTTSEFLTAHDRFVAAEQTAEDAMAEVQRFSELETFDATIKAQRVVMQRQAAVFTRLASEEDADDARLATQAAKASATVLEALDTYAAAVLDRELSNAAFATAQMQEAVAELDAVAAEWKKSH